MGILVVSAGLAAFGIWQLAQRPIDSLWLANRLNAALTESAAPVRVEFGAVTLSWSGFSLGVDEPIDVHVSDLSLVDATGHKLATASDARLGFSIASLIRGGIFPRSVEIEHAVLILTRESAGLMEPDGDTQLRPIPLDRLSAGLHEPRAGSEDVPIPEIPPQLRRVHFRDTDIVFRDAAGRSELRGQHMDLDVLRLRNGHIQGLLAAPLTVGTETTVVRANLDLVPNGISSATMHVAPFRPSVMAQSERLAFLRAIDAPVTLTATAALDRNWYPAHIQASVNLGPGQLRIHAGATPLAGGSAELSGSLAQVAISRLHLDLKRAADGVMQTADLTGTIDHASDRLTASMNVAAGHIDAADLATLWPPGIGGGARPWIATHVTAGIANGAAAFTVEADDSLRDIVMTRAAGDLDVANAAFTWIDHVPPVEQASVHLHLIDPDTIDVLLASGHQRVGPGKADLVGWDGRMHIIGLSVHDQFTDLRVNVKGPITSALALLSEPRLNLLSTHPIGLKPNVGDVSSTLTFQFPLENKLQIDDVKIRAETHLTQVSIPSAVAGHALEGGTFDMVVDRDGLSLKGNGSVTSIPIAVVGSMDFRGGPPAQVTQKVSASGQAQVAALASAGLPIADLISGTLPFTANLEERRDGSGVLRLGADLSDATLTFAPLAFHQPLGRLASASAVLNLQHDQVVGVEQFALNGEAVAVAGSAALPAGQSGQVTLDRFMLARTQARGRVRLAQDGTIGLLLDGSVIDLSGKLTETGSHNDRPTTTPPWTLTGRFDHALLAYDEKVTDLSVVASGGGDQIGMLNVTGATETGGPTPGSFLLRLTPEGNQAGDKRNLRVHASDAGRLLRGLDIVRGLNGGRLTIDGSVPGGIGLAQLSGTASIEDVVVRNSPVLGKLLQAITLYGLVDALRGPGMGFDRIVAPFRYDGRDLYLSNAVAENSSLGLTTSGRIGLDNRPSSLSGTIVPAYFFNALPGRIPLIGRLFSPEKGGGVFAARFGVNGPISDPNVTVNPASALTPGFLRGLFGIFDRADSAAAKQPTPPTH